MLMTQKELDSILVLIQEEVARQLDIRDAASKSSEKNKVKVKLDK